MGFLLSGPGLTLIALVVGLFSFQAWKVTYKTKIIAETKHEIVVDSTKEGIKKNEKATKVRERVKLDPSWADRMFEERYCRDCKTGTMR